MGIKLNTHYKTVHGHLRVVESNGKIILHSRFNTCKLDARKVREHGLLWYLQHVGAMAQRANRQAVVRKYNALQCTILAIQAGAYSAEQIKICPAKNA